MCARGHEDLLGELLELFAAEAGDHLRALNQKILELEKTSDGDSAERLIDEILRHTHTLKGAAAAVTRDDIGALAHHLEDVFVQMRAGALTAEAAILDPVYRTLDAIGTLAAAGTEVPEGVDTTGLVQDLESLIPSIGDEPPPPPIAESPAVLPASVPGPTPEPLTAPAVSSAPEETIRIATAKLDSIMAQVGELLVATSGTQENIAVLQDLAESLARRSRDWQDSRSKYRDLLVAADGNADGTDSHSWGVMASDIQLLLEREESQAKREHVRIQGALSVFRAQSRALTQSVNELQNEVRRARMFPVATIFEPFPRMIRDLAREQGKKVRIEIGGSETEVDRAVLEQLKAPLTHLLRNCVDHGLETPDVRRSASKAEEGTISLDASQQGSSVVIRVTDDGAGIDPQRVVTKAIEAGLIDTEEARDLSETEELQLIFRPGLSTSPIITDVSGRGVGLDVVRESVEQLNGSIALDSEPGRGTVFSMILPLTLVTTKCLLLRVADRKFAIPISAIQRTVRVHGDQIERANGREAIKVEGEPVGLSRLSDVLGISSDVIETDKPWPAVVVDGTGGSVALVADELIVAQDVVVKPLPQPLERVPGIAGVSILGSGEVVPVLNAAEIGRGALRGGAAVTRAPAVATTEAGPTVVLLADDSITTRTLEKNILESAGYQVRAAVDGAEAWALLSSEGADIGVFDVQMPGMDGIELTERIRSDDRFVDFPIILVTSLDSAEDRERGIVAGADAYITKGTFDQEHLLETIRRLS